MPMNPNDVSTSYIIETFKNSINKGDVKVIKTIPGVSSQTITFNGNFGMGAFGSNYSAALRISDGSTTIDYTSEDPGGGASSSNATKIGVGSDRDPRDVVTELVGKINSSALDVIATDNGGTSAAASFKITPGSGKTLTITEDPANVNSGNFGGSSGFTVITDTSTSSSTVESVTAPFKMSINGVQNIRGQDSSQSHKTFIGVHKV